MPELPEVETVMQGLRLRLEGRVLLRAVARRPDMRWPLPPGLVMRLTGARVTSFRRRAKYILMRLDSGWSVLLHLGMSGRMVVGAGRPQRASRCTSTSNWKPTTAGASASSIRAGSDLST